jgi:hypothetical protein
MMTGCARKVCDPCNLEHAGYYHTCWQPWPWPADYRHCHCLQPAAMAIEMPTAAPAAAPADKKAAPKDAGGDQLPEPRKVSAAPATRLVN